MTAGSGPPLSPGAMEFSDGSADVKSAMMERRRYRRIPTNECCLVRVERWDSEEQFEGLVSDVSESGMRVLVDSVISVGTTVTILLANHMVMAKVIHCTPAEPGLFALGLDIKAASEELRALCRQGLIAAVESDARATV